MDTGTIRISAAPLGCLVFVVTRYHSQEIPVACRCHRRRCHRRRCHRRRCHCCRMLLSLPLLSDVVVETMKGGKEDGVSNIDTKNNIQTSRQEPTTYCEGLTQLCNVYPCYHRWAPIGAHTARRKLRCRTNAVIGLICFL